MTSYLKYDREIFHVPGPGASPCDDKAQGHVLVVVHSYGCVYVFVIVLDFVGYDSIQTIMRLAPCEPHLWIFYTLRKCSTSASSYRILASQQV